jgi:hypothetical protein
MVDVVVASDNVVVIGGPSSVDVSVDIGPQGQRGSQIYTGVGRPTEVFLPDVQVNDIYINLKQSDFEYLYLYKYAGVNGQLVWSKVLRLVPNTVLVNPIVRFVNGQAHTIFNNEGSPVAVKGLYFPLAALFPDGTLSISINDLNVQYSVFSSLPVSSGFYLDDIDDQFDIEYLQSDGSYQTLNTPLPGIFIRGFLSAKEDGTAITGFRTVNMLVTVGGRDTNAKYFYANTETVSSSNDTISYIGHGMATGSLVIYLSNGNTAISGLQNEGFYVVESLDSNTFALSSILTPGTRVQLDASATSGEHIILSLAELNG